MTRLIYVILVSLPIVIFYIWRSNYVASHIENYTEEQLYQLVKRMIHIMKRNGKIHTKVFGVENLPEASGYVMYPNHQGKYDALGIISAHKEPCTFLIDQERSKLPLANEFTVLLKASRLDKANPRKQIETIHEVIRQVKSGRHYIIFPEGGYNDNNNTVHEFMPGAFKCSIKAKAPIVPVALVDSYKVFGVNSLRKVTTQVHFLKPLYYEDYKELTSKEIANLVRRQIEDVVEAAS